MADPEQRQQIEQLEHDLRELKVKYWVVVATLACITIIHAVAVLLPVSPH